MDIIPINGHILIKPVVHKSILPTDKEVYEEMGEVIRLADDLKTNIEIGDFVFYDGWQDAKYKTGNGDEIIRLVMFKDVRAIRKKDAI